MVGRIIEYMFHVRVQKDLSAELNASSQATVDMGRLKQQDNNKRQFRNNKAGDWFLVSGFRICTIFVDPEILHTKWSKGSANS